MVNLPVQIDMWEAAWVSKPELYRLVTTRLLERYLELAQQDLVRSATRLHVLLLPSLYANIPAASISMGSPREEVCYLSIEYTQDRVITADALSEIDVHLKRSLARYGVRDQNEYEIGQSPGTEKARTKLEGAIAAVLTRLRESSTEELAVSGDSPLKLVRREKFIPRTLSSADSPLSFRDRQVEVVAQFCEIMYSERGAEDPIDLELSALRHVRLSRSVITRALYPRKFARRWAYCNALSQYFEGKGEKRTSEKGEMPNSQLCEIDPKFIPTHEAAPVSVCLMPTAGKLIVGYARDVSEEHAREYFSQVMQRKTQQHILQPFGDVTGAPLRGLKVSITQELLKYLNDVEQMPIGTSCLITFRVLWLILHEQNPRSYSEGLLAEFAKIKEHVRSKAVSLSCRGALLEGRELEAALLIVGLTVSPKELKQNAAMSVPFENLVAVYDLEKTIQQVALRGANGLEQYLPGFSMRITSGEADL